MANSTNQRSMAANLLIIVGITILAVLVSAGVQVLLFGKTVTAVTAAVGAVCGMAAARQFAVKSKDAKEQKA